MLVRTFTVLVLHNEHNKQSLVFNITQILNLKQNNHGLPFWNIFDCDDVIVITVLILQITGRDA